MIRILTTMPSLMEISTADVSISLLSHIHMPSIPRNRFDGSRPCDDYVIPRVIKSAKTLPLSKIFIELIEKNIRKICESLTNWVDYHYQTIFLKSGRKYDLFCIVSDFVWYPNGAVNYKQTALHLQNSPRLSDVQKFRLLCTYCLKEEIEQKWPVLFENNAYDRLNFEESPLMHYWNSYCRNTLDKISVPVGMSLDSYMFQNAEVNNWPAKEYFFDRMSAEEKIQNTISVIEKEDYMYQYEMLMKLNESQLIKLLCVERPEEVLASVVLHSSVEDALTMWFQMKELISPEHFVSIIEKLFLPKYSCENSIVVEVWTSASNELKHFVLNNNEETFTRLWPLWIKTYEGDWYKMLLGTSVDVRKTIREKNIFTDHCKYLITSRQISLLERLLNLCFDNSEEEELIQFGVAFANKKFFFDFCKHTIIQGHDLTKLKQLWSLLLPRTEDSSRTKLNFAKKMFDAYFFRRLIDKCEFKLLQELMKFVSSATSEFVQLRLNFAKTNYFCQRCLGLISNSMLEKLKTLINIVFDTPKQSAPFTRLFIAPKMEDLFQFKQVLAEKIYTISFLKTSVLTAQKLRRTSPSHLLQELIYLFPYPVGKFAQLKIRITRKEFFLEHCRNLIRNKNLDDLQKEFQFFFNTLEQSAPFRKELINSPSFFYYCRNIVSNYDFSLSKLEKLMDLITFDSTSVIFSADRKSINKFKKKTIFSAPCISILRKLVESNRFKEVKKLFNGFLDFDMDKKRLRSKLFNEPDQLVKKYFFECDESVCKSWMEWWFSDEESLQNCKRKISVDIIFEEGFKKCVFQTYDESGRVSHCTLNKDFEFSALDRFLKWRFDSAKEVKEYKLRRIAEYKSIETVLIKKGCHASYFNKLTEFFFENDVVEMAKFEKKH